MLVYIVLASLFVSLSSYVHSQDREKGGRSGVTAELVRTSFTAATATVELRISNSTTNRVFFTDSPVGYDGTILSVLRASQDRQSLTVISSLENDRGVCSRPFDSSGVYLAELPANSSKTIFIELPNGKARVRPFCGASYEIEISSVKDIEIMLGYFDDDPALLELFMKGKRVSRTDIVGSGTNKGRLLTDLQFLLKVRRSFRPSDK